MLEKETYALGLLTEEFAESGQLIGKALRFGLDTPGVKDMLTGEIKPDTPRSLLHRELGDVIAAIDYAVDALGLDQYEIRRCTAEKTGRLRSATATDNMGRRLAPSLDAEPAHLSSQAGDQ